MEILIVVAIILVIAIAAALLVVFYYLRKGFKFVRRMANGEMTDEDFERLSKKFHKRGTNNVNFDSDYFKGTGKQQQQGNAKKQTQRATFHTKEGVTIVDERTPQSNKKIFAQDEGEYVEFTEN